MRETKGEGGWKIKRQTWKWDEGIVTCEKRFPKRKED
jgi:hypothetical protein